MQLFVENIGTNGTYRMLYFIYNTSTGRFTMIILYHLL